MTLLLIYIFVAVGFSFLCSIAEAVLLSTNTSYIVSAQQEDKRYGDILDKLKENINDPLAVILTINTVAHTVGAAGAGAQATKVFGSVYLGIFSGVLTLIILVFSEIIPKALGAHYWRQLAPSTAYSLNFLVKALYPFVWLSNKLTGGFTEEESRKGFNRKEFAAMAELGEKEGQLEKQESRILQNVFLLSDLKVKNIMTPRPVVFQLSESTTVAEALEQNKSKRFSRIPLYKEEDDISGFVLKNDLLQALADDHNDKLISVFSRELNAILDETSVLNAFEQLISNEAHIMLVVDEYGSMEGVLTMEDILETLLGLEITDESDSVTDMQELAKRLGALRRKRMEGSD